MQSRVSSPKNILSFVLTGMLTVYKGIPLYLSYLNQYNFMGYILHPRNNLNFSVWNTISTESKLKNERWSPKKLKGFPYTKGCYHYFWEQKTSTAMHTEKIRKDTTER